MQKYTIIVFVEGRELPLKYRKVQNLESFEKFLAEKWPKWLRYNKYDSKTRAFVGQVRV